MMPNAMTCDVEDYFQVSAFERIVTRDRWDEVESRIPRNVDKILKLLDDSGAKCTFFTLGWVAERHPALVRQIAENGHEIASHGMLHKRVSSQTPDEFRTDIATAKKLLEDVSGRPVRGYRAASWSIDQSTPWAHSVIGEAGYQYSSSIYPISHDHFGMPSAPTHPYRVNGDGLLEVPASTAKVFGRNLPAAGGGYFRLFPLHFSIWLLRQASAQNKQPAVFYFHPWEMDPEQPRISGAGPRSRFKHYLNLKKFEKRLTFLLRQFKWDRMDGIFLDGAEH